MAETVYAALVLLVGAVLNNVFLSATINLLSLGLTDAGGMDHFAGQGKDTVAGLPLGQAVVIFSSEFVNSDLLPTISKDGRWQVDQ